MRANILLILCCICSTACFAATPVIVQPTTAESKTVTVTTTLPWAPGVRSISLELYLADAQGACSVVAANKLTLSPAGPYSVPAGKGSSDLTLSAPLTAGQKICAIETDSTGEGPQGPASSAVVTVAAKDTSTAPSIASATADSNTLSVKSPAFHLAGRFQVLATPCMRLMPVSHVLRMRVKSWQLQQALRVTPRLRRAQLLP